MITPWYPLHRSSIIKNIILQGHTLDSRYDVYESMPY
jgi:hypothetical protein